MSPVKVIRKYKKLPSVELLPHLDPHPLTRPSAPTTMATPGRIAKSYLQNSIEFRAQPKRKWTVVQEFGSMGGGINGGIAKVKTDDPLNRFFIEKRFSRDDIFYGCAHREIALLHQVGDHPNITRLYDHFVDEKANKASMYMEFCNMGSLQDVSVKVQEGQRLNEHKLWRWFIDSMEAIVSFITFKISNTTWTFLTL